MGLLRWLMNMWRAWSFCVQSSAQKPVKGQSGTRKQNNLWLAIYGHIKAKFIDIGYWIRYILAKSGKNVRIQALMLLILHIHDYLDFNQVSGLISLCSFWDSVNNNGWDILTLNGKIKINWSGQGRIIL